MTGSYHLTHADGTSEALDDNGDGTGTRTSYGPDGEVTGTETVTGLPVAPPPSPTALDIFAALDPETAAAAVAAGVGIAANAGTLWDQLIAWHTALGAPEGTSPDDPAYTFAETITDIALDAATQPGT